MKIIKNITPLSLLYLTSIFFACNTANTKQINTKEELLNKFSISLNQQGLQKINNKNVILNSEFCESFACEDYFLSLSNTIQFYSKDEAFMRGLKNYLVIDNIDTEHGIITIRKRTNNKYESIVIK